jgi:hypothetical protein
MDFGKPITDDKIRDSLQNLKNVEGEFRGIESEALQYVEIYIYIYIYEYTVIEIQRTKKK